MPQNFDVLKVLSYGVIGLGFLLALLAYRLLSREQGKETPNRSILISVYMFMLFSLSLCIVGVASEYLRPGPGGSNAEVERLKLENADLAGRNRLLETAAGKRAPDPPTIVVTRQDLEFAKTLEQFMDHNTIKMFVFSSGGDVKEEARILRDEIGRVKAKAAIPGKD